MESNWRNKPSIKDCRGDWHFCPLCERANRMMRQAKLIDYICTESETLGFLDDIAKNTVSSLLRRNPRITPLFSDRAVSELEKGCRVRLSQLYKNPVLEKILRNARDIDPVMAADLEKMDDAVFREADRRTAKEQSDDPAEAYRKEFPLLRGYEQVVTNNFVTAWEEFFENFMNCRDRISGELFDGREIRTIAGFTGMRGDPHRSGRMVFGVRTDAGTFYYKPHDCRLDSLYRELTEQFFPDCTAAARCVRGPGCGFVSEIECRPLDSPDEFPVYYRNMGMLMALFYSIGGNDMHCGNILPCGATPCAVDLETLFHPRAASPRNRDRAGSQPRDPVKETFRHTAMSTGMLPVIYAGISLFSPMYESLEGNIFLPFFGEQHRSVRGYEENLISGFEEGYRRAMEHKAGIKALFLSYKEAPLRYLRRNTVFYSLLQDRLFRAGNMKSEEARDTVLSQLDLSRRTGGEAFERNIISYEADCLRRGDIPYFCTALDGYSLCGGETDEIICEGYFIENARERAFTFLDRLSETELQFETDLIRACLSNVPFREKKESVPFPIGGEGAVRENLLPLFDELAEAIASSRVRAANGNGLWWSQLQAAYRRSFFHPAVTSASVGQVFALFEKIGACTHDAAEEQMEGCLRLIEDTISAWEQEEASYLSLSFDFGIASVVTACDIMASGGMKAAAECFRHLIRFLRTKELHLCPRRDELIELLAALCMTDTDAPEKNVFLREAFHGLQRMDAMSGELSVSRAAALAMVSVSLCHSCGGDLYKERAAEYLDLIVSRYDGSKKGWRDEKAAYPWLAERGPQSAWIAVCMMKITGKAASGPFQHKAWEILMLSLQSLMDERMLRYNDSLFHGNALVVTALTMAAERLEDRHYRDRAGKFLSAMQARYRQKGAFTICPEGMHDIFDPGFIRGTLGIGSAAAYWLWKGDPEESR